MSGDAVSLRRDQRKQDLLLASRLLRVHAAGAFDELAARADRLAERAAQVRALLANPAVRLAGAALATALVGLALPRRALAVRHAGLASRLVRWGWLGWRVWRMSGPLLVGRYRPRRPR